MLRRSDAQREPLADELDATPDPHANVETQVLTDMAREAIVQAILELPDHLREVAMLALVDELPYQDIAAVTGVPLGTVKSRMAWARTHLVRAQRNNGGPAHLGAGDGAIGVIAHSPCCWDRDHGSTRPRTLNRAAAHPPTDIGQRLPGAWSS